MLKSYRGAALLAIVLAVPPLHGQVAQIGDASMQWPTVFSQVRRTHQLADGTLLVADWIDERVVGLRPDGTEIQIGRAGQGPAEYSLPAAIFPWVGDSALLVDEGNGRLAVIGPDLRIHRSFDASPPSAPYRASPGGVDRQGFVYFLVPGWADPSGAAAGDLRRLARWNPTTGAVDSITTIRVRSVPTRPSRSMRLPFVAFAPHDGWAVDSTGEVWIARSEDYHLERRAADGTVSVGSSLGGARRPVSSRDRQRFTREFLTRSPISGRGPDGGLGHNTTVTDALVESVVQASEFAPTLPFFEPGVWRIGSTLWVPRAGTVNSRPMYDILTTTGARQRTIALPDRARLVGAGRDRIYLAVADANGLEQIRAYPMPPWTRSP